MKLDFWASDKSRPGAEWRDFAAFVQKMANRLMVGYFSYEVQHGGGATRKNEYKTRLEKEVRAYDRTGNAEHLINAANYCWLESRAPEHPNHHWDAREESVTRGKVKLRG